MRVVTTARTFTLMSLMVAQNTAAPPAGVPGS
jgi:hypothetical protein